MLKRCYYPDNLYYMLNAQQQKELTDALLPQFGMDPSKPFKSYSIAGNQYCFEQEVSGEIGKVIVSVGPTKLLESEHGSGNRSEDRPTDSTPTGSD